MSPTMQMTAPPAVYAPISDAMDRHEYGVSKNRKAASTGGGRAWSEDEVCISWHVSQQHDEFQRGLRTELRQPAWASLINRVFVS